MSWDIRNKDGEIIGSMEEHEHIPNNAPLTNEQKFDIWFEYTGGWWKLGLIVGAISGILFGIKIGNPLGFTIFGTISCVISSWLFFKSNGSVFLLLAIIVFSLILAFVIF